MDMKEYEEFALNVQTICAALNNALRMAMENRGVEFIFSPLAPDYIHRKDEVVKGIELCFCVRTVTPLSHFWVSIDPEADMIGILCNDVHYNNKPVYSIRFYKIK